MDDELVNYIISCETMALVPTAHPLYQTKILDTRGHFYSKKTPLELIQESCITQNFITYEGRRNAIQKNYSFQKNIPIPIDHRMYLCAIPTTSPKRWDCSWFFYGQVEHICSHGKNTKIHFYNKQTIIIKASQHQTKLQYIRAGHILAKMNLTDTHRMS